MTAIMARARQRHAVAGWDIFDNNQLTAITGELQR
jgi:hypothetical protein